MALVSSSPVGHRGVPLLDALLALAHLTPHSFELKLLVPQLYWVRGGKLSLYSISKLLQVDLGVSVQVEPPEDGYNLLFTGEVSHAS